MKNKEIGIKHRFLIDNYFMGAGQGITYIKYSVLVKSQPRYR